ncbi:MAG: hypothetical protein H6738_16965 [Alphaproteobacteria bacterium]|nr:hypothetical protein [Alphaproteobacteria bacterium]MCB9698475.1 hypothetical protein [Alphaproteobacteria bacterium]
MWMWMWTGCVVGVEQRVTIDEPVDEIRVHATNATVAVSAHPGPVTIDGTIGGLASGAPELVIGDRVLTLDVDCLQCGGRIELRAPPETRLLVVVDRGAIEVDGMSGDTVLGLDLGDVHVRDHAGPLSVDGGSGSQDLALVDVIGVEATQVEGPITVVVPPGGYALSLSPGTGEPDVDPAITDDPSGAPIELATDRGRIVLEVSDP